MGSDKRKGSPPPRVEAFLEDHPMALHETVHRLRRLVQEAVPEAVEAVVPGWKLIGYRVPLGKKTLYFAYVAPQAGQVRLGFEYGVLLSDPAGLLTGSGSQVRQVDVKPGDALPERELQQLIRDAAQLALSRAGIR